ncbi:hypothetical protein JVT61DRAFT_8372 [Boletus reticuloceps]|uniref:Uncharacterized protein n=1 Tax=Boletus reticuloceps TaxID=495285 RepID=A0A8I2YVK8_9AGAM|nr:hypothetical protein JVT61DRAFT_8372 [Boletus reticuloceps]
MLQDTCQQLRNQQVAQEQLVKALQDRLVATEQGLETLGHVLHQVWPQVGQEGSSISSLQFPSAVGREDAGVPSQPQTPQRAVSPAHDPSSPTPRAITSAHNRRVPTSSPPPLYLGLATPSAPLRPSPFLTPAAKHWAQRW